MDSGAYGEILRSKGFFRLAGRPRVTGLWSQAGSVARFEPTGVHAPDGDGRDALPGSGGGAAQELVFIGTGLRAAALHAALGDCLVTDAETRTEAYGADPFPAWGTYGVDDSCDHEGEPAWAGG